MPPLPSKDWLLQFHNRWTSTTVPHHFFSFFVFKLEKLIVWCLPAKKNYYHLTKNGLKFEASVTERCTSLGKRSGMFRQSLLKVPVKKFQSLKNLYNRWTFSQMISKVSSRIFFTYLPIHLFIEACLRLI